MDSLVLVGYTITALLGFLLPVLLIVYIKRRFSLRWRLPVYAIALSFAFQIILSFLLTLLEIPLLGIISEETIEVIIPLIVGIGVVFALVGAAVEELGRYTGLRFLLKKTLEWKHALLFGAGWGSAAMFLTAISAILVMPELSMILNIGTEQYILMLNETGYYTEDELLQQWQAVDEITWLDPASGLVDGIFMMILSISLSVLLIRAISNRILFLPLVIVLHFLVNMSNVLLLFYGAAVSYGFTLVLIVIITLFVFRRIGTHKKRRQAR